jgi:hypothetical protein
VPYSRHARINESIERKGERRPVPWTSDAWSGGAPSSRSVLGQLVGKYLEATDTSRGLDGVGIHDHHALSLKRATNVNDATWD